jgi:hypothetical protein
MGEGRPKRGGAEMVRPIDRHSPRAQRIVDRRTVGSHRDVEKSQIICACPITVANPDTATLGYQIAAPYPCQKAFLQNCKSATASAKTGLTIYVGALTGTARFLPAAALMVASPAQRVP